MRRLTCAAFALNPDQVETLVAWCQFRAAEQDLAGAWAWLRWALVRDPDNAEAVNMHGILLHMEGRFAEAVEVFERAEALGSAAAASNRGNSLLDLGRMEEALKAHETAVERDPSHPGARYNLALTRLRLARWEQGWQDYEARWRFREVHRRPRVFKQPRWRGEALNGRRVLLHAEQGLGDTIQFCRYATLVAARGGTAILQVQEPVERLMRSLAAVRAGLVADGAAGGGAAGVRSGVPADEPACGLWDYGGDGSLAGRLPGSGACGRGGEARCSFPSAGHGLRVGLAWAGNPRYKADRLRSMKLETLLPLLRTRGVYLDFAAEGRGGGTTGRVCPRMFLCGTGRAGTGILAETAALVATLDLVITTDTCIAHLAGAMGKPVWILLPHLADWRWMQNIETTPWYPTARLLRQKTPGDWAGLVERVISELGALQGSDCFATLIGRIRLLAV